MGKINVQFSMVRNAIIGLLLVILGGVVGYRYGQRNALPTQLPLSELINSQTPTEKQTVDFSTFWEAWDHLEKEYVDPTKVDPKNMVNGAIGGMTSALGDPYTAYLPPVENQRRGEDLAGSFFGVGIELGYVDNVLAVISPLKGMPADKAGVQAGDLIIHVKDEAKGLDADTTGWSLDEAVGNIRGQKGTSVLLTLLRRKEGNEPAEPFEVSVQRDEIILKTVELAFPEHNGKKVAHIKLSGFGERTPGEFETAVQAILAEKNNISGIVLDMRNNPGGLFDDAIKVASEFIEDGTIVTQKGKYEEQVFPAKGKARLAGIPLVVLVNKGSASAAEIVAGALRDQVNAKMIGEKTFGKGTVQDRLPLSNGGGLHVTIAKWLLPKGDWIHDAGIPVSIEIKDDPETKDVDEALNKAIEEL
jgi:carboxyl-terminal processing protease